MRREEQRIKGKIKKKFGKQKEKKLLAVFLCCMAVFASGCGIAGGNMDTAGSVEKGNESGSYSLNGQEIQIHLSGDYEYKKISKNEIELEGEDVKVTILYLEGKSIAAEKIPKTEYECYGLFEDILGQEQSRIEDFQCYMPDGTYHTMIRYGNGEKEKYFIASGNFEVDSGYQITAVLNTTNRERAEEIQNAVYNVKIFRE